MVEAVEGALAEEKPPVAVGEGAADQRDGIPAGLVDAQMPAGGVGGYGRVRGARSPRRPRVRHRSYGGSPTACLRASCSSVG
ncbi:hypothetical protein DT87_32605 [Streptomyces sp. NTK 937]|nr:hypothetical protein DT87_32605 [Streptomyces sp. NTK 937]